MNEIKNIKENYIQIIRKIFDYLTNLIIIIIIIVKYHSCNLID